MNYMTIKKNDIANGPGVRVSLFVSGCRRHCKGCFNASTWSFDAGHRFTQDTVKTILDALKMDYIEGLSILGGEPLEYENIETVAEICYQVKKAYPNKTIWLYTGYRFGQVKATDYLRFCYDGHAKQILDYVDVIVDGAFIESKKDISLVFRGSTNQRIIDVKKTLKTGQIAEVTL